MARWASFAERFWRRVDTSGGPEMCWPWTGRTITTRGEQRGQLYVGIGRPREYAPRVAYRLVTSQNIPNGLKVLHSCDIPICCNPAHLRLGTQKDNATDCRNRRRDLRVRFRLTEADVLEIRRRYATTGETTTDLAVAFNTSNKYVWKVVTGLTWAHVGGPISHGTKRYHGVLETRKLWKRQ